MKKRFFINALLEKEYKENGYAVLTIPDPDILDDLKKIYRTEIVPRLGQNTEFYYSLMNEYSFNVRLKQSMAEILKPTFDSWFVDYKNIGESFMVKRAATNEELLLHQDWNLVDEQNDLVATIWCPLEDISKSNGGFFLIEKSHLFFDNKRSGTYSTGRFAMNQELVKLIKAINIKKGQALAFHPGVFHGSYPNNSSNDRPIVSCSIFPNSSRIIHYVKKDENSTYAYEINEKTILGEIGPLSRGMNPKTYDSRKVQPYKHEDVDIKMLLSYANKL